MAPVLDTFTGAGMVSVRWLGRRDARVMVARRRHNQHCRMPEKYFHPSMGLLGRRLDQGERRASGNGSPDGFLIVAALAAGCMDDGAPSHPPQP